MYMYRETNYGDAPLILLQALLATSATRKHKKKKKKVSAVSIEWYALI